MAEEHGISNMDNDAQLWALVHAGPKENITWCGGAESDANECGIMFLWCSAGQKGGATTDEATSD